MLNFSINPDAIVHNDKSQICGRSSKRLKRSGCLHRTESAVCSMRCDCHGQGHISALTTQGDNLRDCRATRRSRGSSSDTGQRA
ncbi:hypothetical protein CALCODRAFT_309361 [Calocera cornea HHB12733]|uniref:Uncharacterized protein n=1 Tax=Calocera cornea HHB12733 TaxID=1353952 RepID=A0A165FHD0_9BASI|nr:hypothetical protein CALCODRAFT_309361 [Calocera cornea HHB12733]